MNGRGGLGTINVAAAGNENIANGEDWKHHQSVIVVAATDNTGQIASYSNYGSNILVSASGTTSTTDLIGSGGASSGDTATWTGTSFASPTIAGLASLMLSANSGLGYQDVREILAMSSVGAGSFNGGPTTNENFAWRYNGANNWNGGGMHYSEDYGFGVANAFQAVRMAEVWSMFGPATTTANQTTAGVANSNINQSIVDNVPLNYDFQFTQNVEIDTLRITIGLTHSYFTDMRISLRSAEGTTIMLSNGSSGSSSTSDGAWSFTFNVAGLLGENTAGTWRLIIHDVVGGDSGTLQSVSLNAIGRAANPVDDVYHYTEEATTVVAQAGQAGRLALTDSDGGFDWMNLAATFRDVNAFLATDGSGFAELGGIRIANIANGTTIENIVTGDGNDTIRGNFLVNEINGMRGNDTINGFGGDDRLFGGRGNDTLFGDEGNDRLSGGADNDRLFGWTGTDDLFGDDGNDELFGQGDNDSLFGWTGNDGLYGDDGNDRLFGQGGDDRLFGWTGNDELYGDDGNDQMFGQDGDDRMFGWVGNDRFEAGDGNDVIFGQDGFDTIFGGSGNDDVFGGNDFDIIHAGTGNDTLRVKAGATSSGSRRSTCNPARSTTFSAQIPATASCSTMRSRPR